MTTINDTVYRPPTEARSALLELSVGCSYGKCTFCRLADGKTPLQLVSPQVLGDNLAELARQDNLPARMFLSGENVLAFKTRYLLDIFQYVRSYLPDITQFAMYGRADDVAGKSDEQLTALRQAGLDTVYVGVESGSAEVLADCNKGETPEEIVAQLHRLDACGIRYGLSSILGLGGADRWREHELATAALYNQVRPASIRVMTLTPMEGSPLYDRVKSGAFRLPSPRIILQEELLLLEQLDYTDHRCRFVGNHVSNAVPVLGNLPEDKPALLALLRQAAARQEDGPPQQAPGTW